jgi:hypothetical protein
VARPTCSAHPRPSALAPHIGDPEELPTERQSGRSEGRTLRQWSTTLWLDARDGPCVCVEGPGCRIIRDDVDGRRADGELTEDLSAGCVEQRRGVPRHATGVAALASARGKESRHGRGREQHHGTCNREHGSRLPTRAGRRARTNGREIEVELEPTDAHRVADTLDPNTTAVGVTEPFDLARHQHDPIAREHFPWPGERAETRRQVQGAAAEALFDRNGLAGVEADADEERQGRVFPRGIGVRSLKRDRRSQSLSRRVEHAEGLVTA